MNVGNVGPGHLLSARKYSSDSSDTEPRNARVLDRSSPLRHGKHPSERNADERGGNPSTMSPKMPGSYHNPRPIVSPFADSDFVEGLRHVHQSESDSDYSEPCSRAPQMRDARYGAFHFVPAQVARQATQLDSPIFETHPKNFREVGVLYTCLNRYFPGTNTIPKRIDLVAPFSTSSESVLPSQKALNKILQMWFLVRFPTKTETVTLSEKDYQETFRKLHGYLGKIDNTALRAMVMTAIDHLLACETAQHGDHVFDFREGADPLHLPVLAGPKPVLGLSYGRGAERKTLFQAMGTALLPHLTPRLEDVNKTIVVAQPRLSWRDFMAKPAPDIAVQHRFFHDTMGALGDNAAARQALRDARLATSPALGIQLFRELFQSAEARSSETAAVINGLNTAFFVQTGVARLENMRTVLNKHPEEKEALKQTLSVLYAMWMQPDGPSASEIHGQLKAGLLSGCTVQTLDVLLRQFPRLFSDNEIVLPELLGASPKSDMVQAYLDLAGGGVTEDQLNLLSKLQGDTPVYTALKSAEQDRLVRLESMLPDFVVPNFGDLAKKFYDQIRSALNPASMAAISEPDADILRPSRDTQPDILKEVYVKFLLNPEYVLNQTDSEYVDQNSSVFYEACRKFGVDGIERPQRSSALSIRPLQSWQRGSFEHSPSASEADLSAVHRFVDLAPLAFHNPNVGTSSDSEGKDSTPFYAAKIFPYMSSEQDRQHWSAQGGTSTGRDIFVKKNGFSFIERISRNLYHEFYSAYVFGGSESPVRESQSPLDQLLQAFRDREKPVLEKIVDLKTRQHEDFSSELTWTPELTAKSVAWILQLPTAPTLDENIKKAYLVLHAILTADDQGLKESVVADLCLSMDVLTAKYEAVKNARAELMIAETDWSSPLERHVATQLLDFYRKNPTEKAVESEGKVNPKLTKASAELNVLYQAASDDPAAFEKFSKVFFFSGDHDRFWRDMQRLQDNDQVRSRLVKCLHYGHSRSAQLLCSASNPFHARVLETKSQWQSFFSPVLPVSLVLSYLSLQCFETVKSTLSAPVQARILRFQAMSAVISPTQCQLPSDKNALFALTKDDRGTRNTARAILWQFSRFGAAMFEYKYQESHDQKQHRAEYRHAFISALEQTKPDQVADLLAYIRINPKACEALNAAYQSRAKEGEKQVSVHFPLSLALESAAVSQEPVFTKESSDMIVLKLQEVRCMSVDSDLKNRGEMLVALAGEDSLNPSFLAFAAIFLETPTAVFPNYPERTRKFVTWLINRAEYDYIQKNGVDTKSEFSAGLDKFQNEINSDPIGREALDGILRDMLTKTTYEVPERELIWFNLLFPAPGIDSIYPRIDSIYPRSASFEYINNLRLEIVLKEIVSINEVWI